MAVYREQTLQKYLDDLSAKLPAPGGGSAAALAGAMGASLISMVINFTAGKPKYAQYESELKAALEKSERLRGEFLNLVDLDVQAYQSKNIRDALDVPFMVARLAFEGIHLCPDLVTKSNVNLISDVAVAAVLLEGAFASACVNVEINLKSIDDAPLRDTIRKELTEKQKSITTIRKETEEKVGKIIRG